MAGTSTVTYDDGIDGAGFQGGIRKILVDWVSDASDGTCVIVTRKIVGELVRGVTDPGATAPTDNYDIVITDEEGVDVLAACVAAGRLADRDTANSEQAYFFVENVDASPLATSRHPVVCDKLTITVTNAGNSKLGQLILYYRPN
jgi:hypothetical protein